MKHTAAALATKQRKELQMAMISLLSSLAAFLTMIAMASADDKAALLAFRARFSHAGSPPTLPLASWNDSAHFCSWEGVA